MEKSKNSSKTQKQEMCRLSEFRVSMEKAITKYLSLCLENIVVRDAIRFWIKKNLGTLSEKVKVRVLSTAFEEKMTEIGWELVKISPNVINYVDCIT